MSATRRLAVIMFTDIVGYTALMGSDEQEALRVLHTSRDIQKNAIQKHDGKWLKEMGDGVLAQFNSALDAVQCAIEIQLGAQQTIGNLIRIGLHLGDVTIENEDIFGDGVNIASRLQSIADPGGIYFSESVHEAMGAQHDFECNHLADVRLKNVDHSIKTYYITGNGLPSPSKEKVKELVHKKRRVLTSPYTLIAVLAIALVLFSTRNLWWPNHDKMHRLVVLPVIDLSVSQKAEYLADGIQSALITQIGTLGALQVISRTSSIGYKGTSKTVQQIADELHIDLVVESELVRMDDTLQLRVRLIKALPEEQQIWSKTFIEASKSILNVYDKIAMEISGAMHVEVTDREKKQLTQKHEVNPEAYREFLKSQHYLNNFTRKDLELAKESLLRAIEYDPDFLEAHVGMVWIWVVQLQMGVISREEAYPKIKEAEEKLLSYNIVNAAVLEMESSIHAYVEWQWVKGMRELEKAIELNPNNAMSHQNYGYVMAIIGYHDLALQETNLASELDPFNPFIESFYGWNYLYAGDYEKSVEHCMKSLQMSPAHWVAKDAIRQAYFMQGKLEESFQMSKGLYADQNMTSVVEALERGYKAGGFKEGMKQCAEALIDLSDTLFVSPEGIAENFAYAGEYELSFQWLQKAYEAHDQEMHYLNATPVYNPMRDDPRFAEFVRKVNVPRKEDFIPGIRLQSMASNRFGNTFNGNESAFEFDKYDPLLFSIVTHDQKSGELNRQADNPRASNQ